MNENTPIDERLWKIAQKHLGYSDDELKQFRENPRNADVLARSAELKNKIIVLEVVESHGCNSRHRVGDKIHLDGAGNLLTELCPKRVCTYALNSAAMMVFAANEMIYAGVDPNQIRFRRASCFDVGLQCGGWGRIVLELHVEDRDSAAAAADQRA
ncbi:TIGR04076 family protein [Opitutus terrae]|uniref:Uncharacterized protein n=1 Tax=Opitutus terrae (strain DSM 11246 / JCM 15787 / PB90-1) TaxID=452637 RepID=B1ZWX2_OPITP|nr:TIGR04076 family protein [Opitutus terrae]ACB75083.1 conserved hypothetical protein [Opitutus terrae PB90-1]